MQVDVFIDQLLQDITPRDQDFAKAMKRAEQYGQILKNDRSMNVIDFVVGGSCGKRTALVPVRDVDLYVYVNPAGWLKDNRQPYAPASVMRFFQERLEHTLSSRGFGYVNVRRQRHSIGLVYSGENSVHVDVVPARWDGNRDQIVEIPERGTGAWVKTSVHRQMELLDRLDVTNRALRRAIRLLKLWKDAYRLTIPSYALEVLGIHAASSSERVMHPRWLFMQVLRYINNTELEQTVAVDHFVEHDEPDWSEVRIMDPAVPDNNITGDLTEGDREELVECARTTLRLIEDAEEELSTGRERQGRKRLGDAFGYKFARGE
jgi:hypothetical protein